MAKKMMYSNRWLVRYDAGFYATKSIIITVLILSIKQRGSSKTYWGFKLWVVKRKHLDLDKNQSN